MVRVPKSISVSDLRGDLAEVLRRVQGSREPLVITQRGRAAAVMMSVRDYVRREHERQILHALVGGEQDIVAGDGHDLDSVLVEADAPASEDDQYARCVACCLKPGRSVG